MKIKDVRRLNSALHRDIGYLFTVLLIVYSISGIALNHIDDWNPDFMIHKQTVTIKQEYNLDSLSKDEVQSLGELVGETDYKLYDSPSSGQIKIYYENASFHIDFEKREGFYEKVIRRPFFYETNVLHRNSLKGWKWFSDIFALGLIIITITGLFVLKGKYGISGRGKWFMALGTLPPIIAIIIYNL